MKRACRLAALALSVALGGCPDPAVQQAKTFRLGHLAPSAESEQLAREFMLPALAKLGFTEGRNLIFDGRVGRGPDLPTLAREIVEARPTVIIAVGPPALHAARATSTSIPIVLFGDDPTLKGAANMLSAPTENVTGVSLMTVELHGKRLEFLHRAVPGARRVAALLRSPWTETEEEKTRILRAAAGQMGLEIEIFTAAGPAEFASAFAAMRRAGSEALVIGSYPGFVGEAPLLAAQAMESGLPTVCPWADGARSGCLLGYSAKREALLVRLAHLVARILLGASPADLPVELPAEIELAVNLKTARTLGLTIPDAVLARADEIIE